MKSIGDFFYSRWERFKDWTAGGFWIGLAIIIVIVLPCLVISCAIGGLAFAVMFLGLNKIITLVLVVPLFIFCLVFYFRWLSRPETPFPPALR